MPLGNTHHQLHGYVHEVAQDVVERFGGAWNTYDGHGELSGHSEHQTFDIWGEGGRGDPLPEAQGDAMVAWLLGQRELTPLALLIWWGWWWRPHIGWQPYPGWGGTHGPPYDAHIHVVVE